MQKALLMASVIIGAFLFQPSATAQQAEPNYCPLGGTYTDGKCTWSVGSEIRYVVISVTRTGHTYPSISAWNAYISSLTTGVDAYHSACMNQQYNLYESLISSDTEIIKPYTFPLQYRVTTRFYPRSQVNGVCQNQPMTETQQVYNHPTGAINAVQQTVEICPPSAFPQFDQGPFQAENGNNYCYYPAATPDNDDGEDCPPDTIGDCDIPDEPQCSTGGNGMEVCEADPNEKCSSYEHEGKTFYDCPTGCGFIQDQLFCTTEPDSDGEIPDMSNCFKVATGWACPPDSPTPDDNIDNPEKTLPDMTKGDFKETNKGVETRLDATNSLLGDIAGTGKATNQGIADLNAKALAANGILSQIRQNTGATAGNTKDILDLLKENSEAEPLELDNDWKSVFSAGLGITGDETIDDLTKSEITLDQFKSEFQWSSSSSQCPQPRAINILSKTFYMDWQPFCTAFNVLGYFILAAAYFLSIRIAFGGRT